MSKFITIVSGGQSGADRGAMDAALHCGARVAGWCPAGGWAEDYPEPPGVLALYPQLKETPSSDVIQRTEWCIRDSTCCLALSAHAPDVSPGTSAGYAFYDKYAKPHWTFDIDDASSYEQQVDAIVQWLEGFDDDPIALAVGGPRASEYPGIYDIAYGVVESIITKLGGSEGR